MIMRVYTNTVPGLIRTVKLHTLDKDNGLHRLEVYWVRYRLLHPLQ